MEKNGTLASPATALASMVLPDPGGPTNSTPRGITPPRRVNCSGLCKNWIISRISRLGRCMPATSSKVTVSVMRVGLSSWRVTRSIASTKSGCCTAFLPFRAAWSEASLQILAMSAPDNPAVIRANLSKSTLPSIFTFFRCTWKMPMRSDSEGLPI